MALHDEEQRILTEIERQLAAENPRLARRLAELRPMRVPGMVLALLCALAAPVLGLFLLVVAAQSQVALLFVIGTVFTSVIPTALLWRVWLHRLS